MRRLLITGGAGFIGVNFVYYWLQRYPDGRIVVLDSLTYAANKASLDAALSTGRVDFVEGDIRNQDLAEDLLRRFELDTLVHFAAESHVDRSITGPDAFLDTNVTGTHALLKAARSVWLDPQNPRDDHRFHHISTDEVFGSLSATDPAFTESSQYAPNSPYSASKAASDHLVRAYHHTYGLKVTTSNCSNNYGPYHFPEKLIPLCITNILQGRTLPIYGDGKNVRDWLFVGDHCAGIDLILRNGKVGETYNIGCENEWDNLALINLLCETVDGMFAANFEWSERYGASPMATGCSSKELIRFVKDRAGHDRRYAIDITKIRRELGYTPGVSFREGLEKTVLWFLQNPAWWMDLLHRRDGGPG